MDQRVVLAIVEVGCIGLLEGIHLIVLELRISQ